MLRRSRLVAATMRTSTLREFCAPTRRTSSSSITRSRRACSPGLASPISSRNRIPPSAASKSPPRLSYAPVKAPRIWPNSSRSSRSGAMAAQLRGMNGPLTRGPSLWNARAISSLPVPVSPVIRAGLSFSTFFRTCCKSWRNWALWATISGRSGSRRT